MKKLEKVFQKFLSRYQEKREFFERKVATWQLKGDTELYKQGKELLEYLKAMSIQLQASFSGTAQMADDQLKKNVKQFKASFKELHEISKPVWRQWAEAIIVAGLLAFVLRTYLFGLYHVPTGSAEKNILVGDRIWGNKLVYYFFPIKRGDLVIFDRPNFTYDHSNPFIYFWQRYIGVPLPFLGLSHVPDNWVKRVIALPGDTIQGRVEEGKTVVYLNGKKLEEPYVNPFPLIRVRKTTGFVSPHGMFSFLPAFLQKQSRIRHYTFDPSKPLDEQPYYLLTEKEVVRDILSNSFILEPSGTPNFNRLGATYDEYGPFTVPEGKYWVMGDSRKNSEDSRYWGFLDERLVHGRASFIIYSVDSEESFWFFEMLKHPINFWVHNMRWGRSFKGLI